MATQFYNNSVIDLGVHILDPLDVALADTDSTGYHFSLVNADDASTDKAATDWDKVFADVTYKTAKNTASAGAGGQIGRWAHTAGTACNFNPQVSGSGASVADGAFGDAHRNCIIHMIDHYMSNDAGPISSHGLTGDLVTARAGDASTAVGAVGDATATVDAGTTGLNAVTFNSLVPTWNSIITTTTSNTLGSAGGENVKGGFTDAQLEVMVEVLGSQGKLFEGTVFGSDDILTTALPLTSANIKSTNVVSLAMTYAVKIEVAEAQQGAADTTTPLATTDEDVLYPKKSFPYSVSNSDTTSTEEIMRLRVVYSTTGLH